MGLRFRRSVKIFPCVRLNFSRSGISTSVGVRGAHVTYGRNGTRTTVGIPGTGVSYTEVNPKHRDVASNSTPSVRWGVVLLTTVVVLMAIFVLGTIISR